MTNKPGARTALVIATWFGAGYWPAGPGTAGSLAAVAVAGALIHWAAMPPQAAGFLALLFLWPAIWAAGVAEKTAGREDPGFVVVDEVIGQWITIAGALRWNWKSALAAFVLFRLFDIWKPFPVRRLEALHGGLGIVADDVMAGIYGALVLLLLGWCNLY